jgi:hypothetical protein
MSYGRAFPMVIVSRCWTPVGGQHAVPNAPRLRSGLQYINRKRGEGIFRLDRAGTINLHNVQIHGAGRSR